MKMPANSRGSTDSVTPARFDHLFIYLSLMLVFLGGVYALTFALSVVRLPLTRPLAAGVFAVSLLATAVYRKFLVRSSPVREDGGKRSARFPAPIRVVIAAALLLYLALWAMAYFAPDSSFDGLWYHNPTMHFWALEGRVHWIDGGEGPWGALVSRRFNGWPKGIELFGFLMVRLAGTARLLNTLNLPFLVLGVFSIVCLARLFGARPAFAWFAGCLFLFVPVNVVLSLTTLIDPGAAACYIALMAMTAYVVGRIGRGEVPFPLALPLGAALGLSAGVKGPGVILTPLVVLILSVAFGLAARSRRREEVETAPPSQVKRPRAGGVFRPGSRFIAIVLLAMALSGGYWHLRNLLITGSPIHPLGLNIAGRTVFPGITLDDIHPPPYAPGTEDWSQLRRIFFSWLENLRGWRESTAGKDPKSGGLGILWILGGLPALVVYSLHLTIAAWSRRNSGYREARSRIRPFISVILITLVLFFAMPAHHSHKARYVLFLYGPGLAAFAVAAGWVVSCRRRLARRAGKAWFGLAAGLMVFQGFYASAHQLKAIGRYYPPRREGAPACSRFGDLIASRPSAGYFWSGLQGTAFEYIFGNGKPVAFGPIRVMAQPILGHFCQFEDFGVRKIHFIEPKVIADAARIEEFIRRRGIRYVIWQQGMPVPPALRRLTILDETAGRDFRVLFIEPGEGSGQ
jgi:hypothetical protein